jgi:hypothetical protein
MTRSNGTADCETLLSQNPAQDLSHYFVIINNEDGLTHSTVSVFGTSHQGPQVESNRDATKRRPAGAGNDRRPQVLTLQGASKRDPSSQQSAVPPSPGLRPVILAFRRSRPRAPMLLEELFARPVIFGL